MELERYKADLDAQVQLQKEQIKASAMLDAKSPVTVTAPDNTQVLSALTTLLQEQKNANEELVKTLTKPKRIVRDNNGRALGVE